MPKALLLGVACAVLLTACGSDGTSPDGGGVGAERTRTPGLTADRPLVIGNKDFTEQRVLAQLYLQGLAAAGVPTADGPDLDDEKVAQRAVRTDAVDAYPEYTGTALLAICDRAPAAVPREPQDAYRAARRCLERRGLTAFPPTPFTSSQEVAVTPMTAERLGLRTISDLARVDQDLTLYGPAECRVRPDCLVGLRRTYGLRFRRFVPIDASLRQEVLRTRPRAVSVVFTTDPQNRRDDVVLLADDRSLFPPYNSTLVVRDEVARAAGPVLPRALAAIQSGLTDEVMQELNARVDLDGVPAKVVAAGYLRKRGLLDPAR